MSCDVGKAHSPTFPSLHLHHSSAHSPTFLALHVRHSSFSNPSVALPTSQLILQSFRRFTYVTAHAPTLPSLYLRHSSFSNPSVASPTSQFILQPFFRFSYVTNSSLNSPGEPAMVVIEHNIRPSYTNNSILLDIFHKIMEIRFIYE